MQKTNYSSITGFEQFVELRDYRPATKSEYVRMVRRCADYFQCDPATLSEDQVRRYFLYLRQERRLGASSMKVVRYALQTFIQDHLHQGDGWRVFEDLRVAPPQTLPRVLTHGQVMAILAQVRELRFSTCMRLIYHTGLRISEALHLQLRDLEGSRTARPRLRVRHGKGNKDRSVPMSPKMVDELRQWWLHHRHPTWLFPSRGRGQSHLWPPVNRPMSISSIQLAFRLAWQVSRVQQPASLHTLRHSYATRLLEAGVGLRQIARYLGHQSIDTTQVYTHLTEVSEAQVHRVLDRLYDQLGH